MKVVAKVTRLLQQSLTVKKKQHKINLKLYQNEIKRLSNTIERLKRPLKKFNIYEKDPKSCLKCIIFAIKSLSRPSEALNFRIQAIGNK